MREVKFRAWDGERWYACSFPFVSDFFGRILQEKAKAVCQFTGLTDKNGQEIYEGDVCVFSKDGPLAKHLTVEWRNGGFILTERDRTINLLAISLIEEFGLDVIGNIYENPELLKPKVVTK